jgi:hypothetical protein
LCSAAIYLKKKWSQMNNSASINLSESMKNPDNHEGTRLYFPNIMMDGKTNIESPSCAGNALNYLCGE